MNHFMEKNVCLSLEIRKKHFEALKNKISIVDKGFEMLEDAFGVIGTTFINYLAGKNKNEPTSNELKTESEGNGPAKAKEPIVAAASGACKEIFSAAGEIEKQNKFRYFLFVFLEFFVHEEMVPQPLTLFLDDFQVIFPFFSCFFD